MIHLSFKGAKLPARSLTPCGLERPLQTPGTGFHFAISKNLSLCASVSCQYKVQKSCFLQTAGIRRTHTPYMLVWSTHMHNYAALILLHCAKQRRNVWQLLVLRYLSNKGPLCVCMSGRKLNLPFPSAQDPCAPFRWTCLTFPSRKQGGLHCIWLQPSQQTPTGTSSAWYTQDESL